MGFYVNVIHSWHCCPPPPPPKLLRMWRGSADVECEFKHHWCIFFIFTNAHSGQRGHTVAFTAPHNRAKYKDVTFLWFFNALGGNDVWFSIFAFRVPYIYAVFYNVSFNIVMYIHWLTQAFSVNVTVYLPLVFICHTMRLYMQITFQKLIFFFFSGLTVAEQTRV